MSETRSRDVSLGGPEWSRGTSAADAGEGVASEGAVRKRDAETMARLDADVRALLFSGWAPSAIRLELGCGTERINLALSRMDDADRARREAATSTRSRSRSAIEPMRVFAIPTPTGGRICGRLDSNADLVAAVRRRTGLDPWDYEERAG